MAYIINIETATEVCSVSVANDNDIIFYREETAGPSHATLLGTYVDEAVRFLREKNIAPDAVAVSCGPGSYTGLRIGVSEAKGVCYGYSIPMIAIKTLEVISKAALMSSATSIEKATLLCPMIDARRMEVYDAIYNTQLNELKPTSADIIDEHSFSEILDSNKVAFFGNGSAKCKDVITHNNAIFIDGVYPSAAAMVPLSTEAYEQKKFVDSAYFEPFYLKDFVATIPKNKVLNSNS